MALTKLQALVSRERRAEVYTSAPHIPDREGDAATVVSIRNSANGTWIALLEFNDGLRVYVHPMHIEPSQYLLDLIASGAYSEIVGIWGTE